MLQYFRVLRALWHIRRKHRAWFNRSDRSHAEPEPWPEGFDPRKTPVYSRNQIKIARPPEELFLKLALAEQWPDWYENAANVEVHRPPTGQFARDARTESPVREPVPARGGASEEPEREPTVPTPAIPGEGGPPQLGFGVEFTWTTFGIRVRSTVTEFEHDRRIGWTARALGVRIFHRWFFTPEGGGTLIVTEECEKGPLPWLIRWWMNRALHAGHRLWLESLRADPG
jgi:hypothetical protein